MKLAAIDIGSNSIKLIVAESLSDDSFAVRERVKEVVRLGHDTLRDGHLAPAAIERAIRTINNFRSAAEKHKVEHTFAIATASVREADNASEFVESVLTSTGIQIDILSGIEEARLIGVAAAHGCAGASTTILNVDIGGGSTELSLMDDGASLELFSVKLGAVGLTERFISGNTVKPKELRALVEEVRAAFERPARELRSRKWQQTSGTSGTIISIGEALTGKTFATNNGRNASADDVSISLGKLEEFNSRMARMTLDERQGVPGISQQRAEIIVAGGQILEGAMRAFDIKSVKVCDWALREGVILDRLRELAAETRPPLPDKIDPRLESVRAIGAKYDYEEEHASCVAALAENIFDDLTSVHRLGRHYRTLLAAAALLHDIGYIVAHESHHKHSLYLIKHSELTGFSESDRDVIANVARYHRRALPKERHTEFAALNETQREAVWKLGAILRVADALDRSHLGRVRGVRCASDGKTIEMTLRPAAEDCENELWAVRQKNDMFEQVFNCKLNVRAEERAEVR
ncbi:MAG: Ppx/GppA family phosphatase [Pyrinomonadaceae bacterium]|nr:Ppx/GppA family phosphatase [Pyrinomonadaceae bacterium]